MPYLKKARSPLNINVISLGNDANPLAGIRVKLIKPSLSFICFFLKIWKPEMWSLFIPKKT